MEARDRHPEAGKQHRKSVDGAKYFVSEEDLIEKARINEAMTLKSANHQNSGRPARPLKTAYLEKTDVTASVKLMRSPSRSGHSA